MKLPPFVSVAIIMASGCMVKDSTPTPEKPVRVQVKEEKTKFDPRDTTLLARSLPSYITRAIELIEKHIPEEDPMKVDYLSIFRKMEPLKFGKSMVNETQVKLDSAHVYLAITGMGNLQKPDHVIYMCFDSAIYARHNIIMIRINEDIYDFGTDMDLIVCGIIHEVTHAIQELYVKRGYPEFDDNLIGNENAAWNNQSHIYFSEHPEMLVPIEAVNCETFKDMRYKPGHSVKSFPDIGSLHMYYELLIYNCCGRRYIEHLYSGVYNRK